MRVLQSAGKSEHNVRGRDCDALSPFILSVEDSQGLFRDGESTAAIRRFVFDTFSELRNFVLVRVSNLKSLTLVARSGHYLLVFREEMPTTRSLTVCYCRLYMSLFVVQIPRSNQPSRVLSPAT